MNATDKRKLGKTAIEVSLLGFGSAPLGDLYARTPDDQALATVAKAYDAGVTLFDSAPLYGHGLAEHRVGTILKSHPRDSFVISTKVGRVYGPPKTGETHGTFVGGLPFEPRYDYSYDGAMRAIEQSMLRLATSRLDIVLIHDVDVWTHGPDMFEQRFKEAMDGAYRALDDLRRQGAVGAIGCGLNESDKCLRFAKAGDFDCFLLAGRYSLLEQGGLDEFLPLCVERRIGILLGGVYNSGILATGPVAGARYNYKPAPPDILEQVRRIEAVCRAHSVPLPIAALQFPAAHPAVASLVIGAVSPAEVERNVASLAHAIPAGLWSDLKAEGLLRADAPVPA